MEGSDSTEAMSKGDLTPFPTFLPIQETKSIDEACPPS
jgi:hypothetical protein